MKLFVLVRYIKLDVKPPLSVVRKKFVIINGINISMVLSYMSVEKVPCFLLCLICLFNNEYNLFAFKPLITNNQTTKYK